MTPAVDAWPPAAQQPPRLAVPSGAGASASNSSQAARYNCATDSAVNRSGSGSDPGARTGRSSVLCVIGSSIRISHSCSPHDTVTR
jgi:hypothetical protein